MLLSLFRKTLIPLSFSLFVSFPSEAMALRVVDYQRKLNPRFQKQKRPETRFIIIHSTESRLPSALRTLSRGKARRGRYITRGGHAHYLIAKDGTVYRILDPKYWANHAGVSMWKGLEGISDYSIGIELEGYHNVPFSDDQYKSLTELLEILQKRYGVEDRDVLEHYRIAYSAPNRFHQSNQRGRKLDPGVGNFDRLRAGLTDEYADDPDVIAGRIDASPALMKVGGHTMPATDFEEEDDVEVATPDPEDNRITRTRTAWQIAGSQYNAPTTLYRFPNGRSISGDEIRDWSDIPPGTAVELGMSNERATKVVSPAHVEVLVPQITATQSAWKIANALYNSSLTFYVLPDGRVLQGNAISQVATLPETTKVLVAYREVASPQTRSVLGEDLADVYLAPRTLYLFPDHTLRSGDQIENFALLPAGTRVFAKVE